MSHFVSSKGNRNFEELEQQLLRREPVDHEAEDAEEEIEAVTEETDERHDSAAGSHRSAASTRPSSPAQAAPPLTPTSSRSRGRPHGPAAASSSAHHHLSPHQRTGGQASPSIASNARSPSYSRTNSPERNERPRSPVTRNAATARPRSLLATAAETTSTSETPSHDSEATPTPSRIKRPHKNVAFSTSADHASPSQPLLGAPNIPTHLHARRNTGMIDQSEAPKKLGTWDGVFVPVTLNILGVILFLRFGFILGQAGLLGALALLAVSYTIDALTSMSISAISTNGVVRAGGIFYLASRSLGPEFGGATGLLFWLGQALNASLNALGFVETLTDAFGQSREEGGAYGIPEGPWWSFAYGSFVLLAATVICLVGSRLFVRATMVLAVILAISIASIPVSSFLVSPYADEERGIFYTGWSLDTLRSNLLPHFTSDAAGSASPGVKEDWSTVFGVLFPAVTGVLAGASMSGDLRKPSKSIPKGTNWSLFCTFIVYTLVFVVLAGTTARTSFYQDIGVMGDIAAFPFLITIGALASTAFSALMGVQACGKVLQAIARDHLLPVLDVFAQGTEVSDTPTYGILATYMICQLVLFVDSVNVIAQLVTMTSLLCFAVLSFACLALKAGGAPSFRPSFPYFSIYTAAAGSAASLIAMFFTDGMAASACILVAIVLFVAIHIFSPPKPWGDVTRNVHYWLTRKYLLRLDERKTNLKHWRPQVLLLANNPRSEWNLIIFCNSLKKGGLYVLGHCIKGEFSECLLELRKQQIAWLKLVDLSGIKSFVDVVIANDERQGARSLILSAGLGGMRPNIVVLGFPRDLQAHVRSNIVPMHNSRSASGKSDESEITIRGPHAVNVTRSKDGSGLEHLPTDATRREAPITASAYVGIIEDALSLNKAVAVAYGFDMMQLPGPSARAHYEKAREKQYIDLWPIQIASPDSDPEHAWDTYTMVLQLGTILSLTGTWKSHQLRVSVFVEDAAEVEGERKRVRSLLDNLRIPASLRVFCLADGSVTTYECIVKGSKPVDATPPFIEQALCNDPWWNALKDLRREDEVRAKAAAAAAAAAKRKSELLRQQAAATNIPESGHAGPSSAAQAANAAQRKKREQKILGYSLPPEHMEYFKRNIRIGLSHPRAKPRVDDSDVEDDDSGSDSDESGLSDELLRLGEDDFFGAGSQGMTRSLSGSADARYSRGGKSSSRARSYSHSSHRQHQYHLPDEPTRQSSTNASSQQQQQHQRSASPTPSVASYGSMSSTPIVRPDGTLVKRGSSRGITRRNTASSSTTVLDDKEGTLKASDRQRLRSSLSTVLQGGGADSQYPGADADVSGEANDNDSDAADDAADDAAAPQHRHSRSFSDHPSGRDVSTAMEQQQRRPRAAPYLDVDDNSGGGGGGGSITASTSSSTTYTPLTPNLAFNTLPNSAQFLILNEMFRSHSSSSATSVILTSLPAPETGTAKDEARVQRYLAQLEILCAGSTPVLGIHARELTLSMSL